MGAHPYDTLVDTYIFLSDHYPAQVPEQLVFNAGAACNRTLGCLFCFFPTIYSCRPTGYSPSGCVEHRSLLWLGCSPLLHHNICPINMYKVWIAHSSSRRSGMVDRGIGLLCILSWGVVFYFKTQSPGLWRLPFMLQPWRVFVCVKLQCGY